MVRAGRRYTTTRELRLMQSYALAGVSVPEIAKTVHRSKKTVERAVYGASWMICALRWQREGERQAALERLGVYRTRYIYGWKG